MWRCRAIKVDAIVDLHRNLITGLRRHWPQDPRREARILSRANHTFDDVPDRWMDILAGGAYAEMEDKEKGTLAPGKLADLAVLSQDIFHVSASSLPETGALMTMVDGKIVSGALNRVK